MRATQPGMRTEHWATQRHRLEINHGKHTTQCAEECDEFRDPTKVSMAGQWERISGCPLEKWLETSCHVLPKESATVALFAKWVFSSVIYLGVKNEVILNQCRSQSQGQIFWEESTGKSHEDGRELCCSGLAKPGASEISSEKERSSGRLHCRLRYPTLGENANLLFSAT